MYALRERRQHVTQEDFEFAVAKVGNLSFRWIHHSTVVTGIEEEPGRKHVCQQAFLIVQAPEYRHVFYTYLTCVHNRALLDCQDLRICICIIEGLVWKVAYKQRPYSVTILMGFW
jgi:hypothetical protein